MSITGSYATLKTIMKYIQNSSRQPSFERRVLYSPSTHRVIAPVDIDLIGTIQLNATFQPERVLYAAPIDMSEMSDSWSNQDIDDWKERDISVWADLAANNK